MKIAVVDIENAKDKKLKVEFNDFIEDVPTESPIKAEFVFEDLRQTIRAVGKISADMILQCNRCLEEFVLEADVDVDECFYKTELFSEHKNEREVKFEAIGQDLNGANEIDVKDLIYQSLILYVPNDCVCDINCNGDESVNKYLTQKSIDPRLEIFKNIKIEKDK